MLKTLLDTIRSEFQYLAFFFALGFIIFPVISWQSEYDKDCETAQKIIKQYLADSYQIDTGIEEQAYVALCNNSRSDSNSLPSWFREFPETIDVLHTWQEHEQELIENCEEVTDILFCKDREPNWVKAINVIQGLFLMLWFVLALVTLGDGLWREWPILASLICGLGLGWYAADWLYR